MKGDTQKQVRVILADDHAVVRKGIREFLEEDAAIRVVAEANDGEEAVALVAREQPDVALFDIQMPRLSGGELCANCHDGLAAKHGGLEVSGVTYTLFQSLSPGYGFTGFLISWLAGGRPVAIVVMAFLFAFITATGYTLQITQSVPYAVVNILLAVILFVVLARGSGRAASR